MGDGQLRGGLRWLRCALVVGLCAGWASALASAHHSFVVEYDVNSPIAVDGVVTKLEWTNPHAILRVDVTEADGATTAWSFDLASPNVLEASGWTRRTLGAGDRVTIRGYRGFAVATRGMVSSITTADGRALVPGERSLRPGAQPRH